MIGQHSFQLLHWDGSLEPFVGTLDMPRLPCSEEAQIEKGLVKQELLPAAPFSVVPFPMSEDDSKWSQIPAAGVNPSKGPLAEASDTKRQGWEPWSARLAVGQNHGVQIQVREASLQDGDMRSQILICVWRNIIRSRAQHLSRWWRLPRLLVECLLTENLSLPKRSIWTIASWASSCWSRSDYCKCAADFKASLQCCLQRGHNGIQHITLETGSRAQK